jgi:hypothetical protein
VDPGDIDQSAMICADVKSTVTGRPHRHFRSAARGCNQRPTSSPPVSVAAARLPFMNQQHAEGTFEVVSFAPAEVIPAIDVTTAMQTGVAVMEKRYTGAVAGQSATLFTSAMNVDSGAASYVAMESFAGSLNGAEGSFNFVHAASTHGEDRYAESFAIVAASGTAELATITGGGGMTVDADGTHRVWFDYSLDQ